MQKELSAKNNSLLKSKSNRIEFDINLGCLRVYFNNCDEYFLCDVEDRDIAEKYCWYKDKYGYVMARARGSDKDKKVKFHRLVMEKHHGNISNITIDHSNHNRLDNRKFNLRLCADYDNAINSRGYSNTGEKYISYNKSKKRYIVQIRLYNKRIAKNFITLDEAISFRDNYIKDNPNDFYYDPNEDYINRNNPNAIHPFKFINPDNIIQLFKFIN